MMEAVVDFVIIDARLRTPKFLVFTQPPRADLQRHLEFRRAPWMAVDLDLHASEELSDAIMAAADRRADSEPFKSLGFQQVALRHHVQEALWTRTGAAEGLLAPGKLSPELRDSLLEHMEESSWLVLDEVALQRIVRPGAIESKQVRSFIRRSSVDILVVLSHDTVPSFPLLAIEFDGPDHDKYDQQLRDSLKSCLLSDAGVPLIRVSYHEGMLTRWDSAECGRSSDVNGMIHRLRPLTRLIRLVLNRTKSEWLEAHRIAARQVQIQNLAKQRFAKNYSALSDRERLELEDMPTYQDLSVEEMVEQHASDEFEKDEASLREVGDWLRFKKLDPARAEDLAVDHDNGRWTARFTYVAKSGARTPLELPGIVLNGAGLSVEELCEAVHWYALEEVAAIVEELAYLDADPPCD